MEVKRISSAGELQTAVDWAAKEGWNPGLHDAEKFYAADKNGFFIAYDAKNPAGTISAVTYGEDFGFIGLFIVKPALRGGCVGISLGKTALEYLGERNIGVDGVPAKVESYKNYGFRFAHNNVRYEGTVRGPAGEFRGDAREISDADFAMLESYDSLCFPAPRTTFLREWLKQPQGGAMLLENGGKIAGYGVIRKCVLGYKIGPLFADGARQAQSLLTGLLSKTPQGEKFYLDIPEPNAPAREIAAALQMSPVFKTARMYSRSEPPVRLERVFGVTSFELG